MSGYKKLGRSSQQRKAMLRNLVTNLIYLGEIKTTECRAKETKRLAEKLITLAIKNRNDFKKVAVQRNIYKKDKQGKRTGKELVLENIKKDNPDRLNARRKMLKNFYPVYERPDEKKKKRLQRVDLPAKMFEEIAARYADRNGGYTRIIKLGWRKGDAAEMVLLRLV